jgi:periplasmic protein TonB
LSAYRLSSPYERPPLQRRASGLALAVGVNVLLVLILLTIGEFAPEAKKVSQALVVDLLPESHSVATQSQTRSQQKSVARQTKSAPAIKPPPIVLPAKPTIAVPPPTPETAPAHSSPWIEMSKDEMASSDIGNLPKTGSGSAGDSQVAGRGPHGEVLYAAEWARHPTDAELGGYLPHNAGDGFGMIACKTLPGNRVDDCVELDQTPGSHLASAVRQAAWQFRVRPPRKNGVPLVGSWVSIRIDYYGRGAGSAL